MINRGKLVILAMLAVGLVAAATAWWYLYQRGHRVLELWGGETAFRLRAAPDCQLLMLNPVDPSTETEVQFTLHGQRLAVVGQIPLPGVPGFQHVRQALVEDASYLWDVPAPSAPATWRYALRFRDSNGETVLAFDLDQGLILDVHQGRRGVVRPIAAGLRQFFEEQVARAGSKET